MRFADYAQAMGEHLATRVDRWATLNEPWCSAFLGHCAGYFASGRKEPGASLAAAYNLIPSSARRRRSTRPLGTH